MKFYFESQWSQHKSPTSTQDVMPIWGCSKHALLEKQSFAVEARKWCHFVMVESKNQVNFFDLQSGDDF